MVKTLLQPKTLASDGHQHINRDSDPDLSLHGVLASSVEHFDAKVLFDPFEKQFYLPTALIDLGDGQCWKQKVVGQELESLLCFDIEITDSAQGIGIGFRGIDGGQNDGVIGSHTCGLVYRMGVAPLQQDILFGAYDEECRAECEHE